MENLSRYSEGIFGNVQGVMSVNIISLEDRTSVYSRGESGYALDVESSRQFCSEAVGRALQCSNHAMTSTGDYCFSKLLFANGEYLNCILMATKPRLIVHIIAKSEGFNEGMLTVWHQKFKTEFLDNYKHTPQTAGASVSESALFPELARVSDDGRSQNFFRRLFDN